MGWMSDHALDIRVWDVGHGGAAFLRAGKKNIVIDCGVNSEFSPAKWIRNEYGVTNLHYMIISHPHHDHIRDLDEFDEQDLRPSIINRPKKARGIIEDKIEDEKREGDGNDDYIEDAEIYLELDDYSSDPDPRPSDPNWAGVEDNRLFRTDGGKNRGVTFHNYRTSDPSLGDDDWETLNNLSNLTVVNAFGFRYVSAGDLLKDGIDELMGRDSVKNAIKDADVFVAPHHGREESFDEDFVEHINPDLVVFSDKGGVDNTATDDYCEIANGREVDRNGSDEPTERYVLTTRNDGRIRIEANNQDDWQVSLYGKNYAEQQAASKAYKRIGQFK